ncbi:Neural/ectodermal development factor IMP-L2 like protein [Argiope bruennichi]|uniref:Neural/ectodermal development factor IMP-L2 like protein n=1 Tax=Argiope bruennichi TaxID=94029 RepID=A0A8T0F6S9_ARGBR|nr:Neural/ectodermal development factor IMP-L2 like protein [Argiope bruennichi]
MVLTMFELVLFVIPFCLGRIMDSPPAQELGKGKIYLLNKDASKRALQPALNIRNGPAEFLDIMAGDNKFLECEAGGTPPPTIHWLKDGQKIPQVTYYYEDLTFQECSPARIHMWTHTRLELMGSDVQLFCRPTGDPQPHVVWRGPNNNVLNNSKKYEIMSNGDLIVRNIMWSDMGGYSCQTKNSEGSDEALVFLYPTMPDNEADM